MSYELFDETAHIFARNTDAQIDGKLYVRGGLFTEAVKHYLPRPGRILDYGCGPGRIAKQVAQLGHSVLGLDVSEGMIAEAQRQDLAGLSLDFSVLRNGLTDLPLNTFDGIVCSSVIEYVPDPLKLVQEWVRLLRDSGILILSFANRNSLWRKYACWRNPQAPHLTLQHNIWSFADCRRALTECGLTVCAGPTYYDAAPFDTRPLLAPLSASGWIGTLGLVVARKGNTTAHGR